MGADEVGTLAALKALRRDVVDPAIAEHQGRIVKTTGDGMLVEFASAVDAVNCAMGVQGKMTDRNCAGPNKITFRIGINVGDIIIDGDDIFGDGVNVAARVENECQPGSVCLSDDAFRQVRGKTSFVFDDLGERPLKNIDRPVRLYAARSATPRPYSQPSSSAETKPPILPAKPSIAVLPFENMSGDPEQEYFSDGMVEDIITALSRFKSLFVIARNSSFTYKGKIVDVRQVGRELGVRYVLEGSVRRAGGRLRINAQLIDATNNKHLWAEKLDGELTDVFALQDALTQKIVSSVSMRLEKAELQRAETQRTTELGAYELYLKGMAAQRYHRHFEEAYDLFRQAFTLDPSYAAAYAMAASCLSNQYFMSGTPLSVARHEEMIKLAQITARLPHEDEHALARAAHILAYFAKQPDLAKDLIERAVELNPNHSFTFQARGWIYVIRGDAHLALESFSTALRLDPVDPNRINVWAGLACAHNILKNYAAGYQWAKKAADALPDIMFTLAYFVINAVPFGCVEEAREAVSKMLQLKPNLTLSEVLELCYTRDQEWFERMRNAFREAGVPE
jgi:adenylate cyclase